MSQFYDQASLVMVPSGYKAGKVYSQKPLSTDGELTFTRNSNATRVNADGLVEKVRTNELVYSQDFTQTAWTNNSTATLSSTTTVTPAGTTDAVRVTSTAATQDLRQIRTITSGLPYTNSAYIRRVSGTGTVRIIEVNGSTLGITPTSEWQRFSITSTATSTTGRFYIRLDTSGDSIEVWGCQMEISDFGPTQYIPTTSAAVSVGPTANVPRLNYSNGCPSLLLEPQCSALNLYSEQINNAAWGKVNATVTANQTASPSGYVDADLVIDTAINTQHAISQNIAVTSGNNYTASFFIKSAGITSCTIRLGVDSLWSGGAGPTVEFNLTALTGNIVAGSGVTYTIEDYGNGWRRCSLTGTCVTSGTTAFSLYLKQYYSYLGDGTSGLYVWGANLTATSYLQSYVPTLGASVTRVYDDLRKLSISSLIGQTEGVWYLDFTFINNGASYQSFMLSNGTSSNMVYMYRSGTSDFNFYINSQSIGIFAGANNTRYKIAFAYKAGQHAVYINGTQVLTSTSSVATTALSQLNADYINTGLERIQCPIHQILLFKTRLSNADLETLTAL